MAYRVTGKSTLASVVVDEARKIVQQADRDTVSKVVFFYCKDGIAQKNTFMSVVQSLLYQLSFDDEPLTDYLDTECSASGETTLKTLALARKLLEVLLRNASSVFIVIDGLDECLPKEKSIIISSFRTLATVGSWTPLGDEDESEAESGALRCLFVSQEDAECVRLLRDIPVVRIRPEDNAGDIRIFCKHWEDIIRKKYETADIGAGSIADKVAILSEGMAALYISELV